MKRYELYKITSDIFAINLEINKILCKHEDFEEFEKILLLKRCECCYKRNTIIFTIYKHSNFFEEIVKMMYDFCVGKDIDVEKSQKTGGYL